MERDGSEGSWRCAAMPTQPDYGPKKVGATARATASREHDARTRRGTHRIRDSHRPVARARTKRLRAVANAPAGAVPPQQGSGAQTRTDPHADSHTTIHFRWQVLKSAGVDGRCSGWSTAFDGALHARGARTLERIHFAAVPGVYMHRRGVDGRAWRSGLAYVEE